MAEEKRNDQADWQKNAGRPSNFHEKDEKLRKDGDGNLKMDSSEDGLTKEENEAIEDTLNSISGTEDDDDSK